SLSLVADFEQVMQRWHAYRQLHAQGWLVLDNGFLGSVACAGVDAGLVAELNQPQGSASPLAALIASRLQLQRMLKLWLGVIALVVLGGWAG
ncbi:MAG: beta-lactamase induction protein, partial [Dokdonella sp.]